MKVVVDSRVRLSWSALPEKLWAALMQEFTHDNPAYNGIAKDEPPAYRTWVYPPGSDEVSFPRGGLKRVLALLAEHGIWAEVEDRSTWQHSVTHTGAIPLALRNPDGSVREPRDYQRELVSAAVGGKTCVLRAPTGAGKTTAGFSLIAHLQRRSLVVVWTGALLKQWQERAVTELGMRPEDVGIVRSNKTELRPLTIGMQQTIDARFAKGDTSLADAFDVVLVDELQRFAAPTLFRTIDPFSARYRVGISADETRKDQKEFLIYDQFGAPACSIDEERLIQAGAVVDVEMSVIPTEFRAPWYRFRPDFVRLLDHMTQDEARNAQIIRLAVRTARKGHQVLVFTHRVDHAKELDRAIISHGIPSGLLLGGKDCEQEFDRTRGGIKRGAIRVGVGTYQSIAQGIDLPSVSRGIATTPIANNKQQLGQVRGRLARPSEGKSYGKLAIFWDRAIYGRKTIENLARWQRTVRIWDARGKAWMTAADYLAAMRSQ